MSACAKSAACSPHEAGARDWLPARPAVEGGALRRAGEEAQIRALRADPLRRAQAQRGGQALSAPQGMRHDLAQAADRVALPAVEQARPPDAHVADSPLPLQQHERGRVRFGRRGKGFAGHSVPGCGLQVEDRPLDRRAAHLLRVERQPIRHSSR